MNMNKINFIVGCNIDIHTANKFIGRIYADSYYYNSEIHADIISYLKKISKITDRTDFRYINHDINISFAHNKGIMDKITDIEEFANADYICVYPLYYDN